MQTKASRKSASEEDRKALEDAIDELRPVLEQLEALETELAPYEQIKTELTRNGQRYRELTFYFVTELRIRCDGLSGDEEQALVLDLFAQDIRSGLDAALAAR